MKIAINCCYYTLKGGGIREYIYNLITNIVKLDKVNNYIFYIYEESIDLWNKTMPSHIPYKLVPFNSKQKIKRSLFQDKFWIEEEKIEKFDIFHSPFFYSPSVLKCKIVLTVHDLRFKVFPETYEFIRRFFLYRKVKKSIKNSKHIISISNFTKSEILKYYKIDERKVSVIHEAVDRSRFRTINNSEANLEIHGLKKYKYLLSVGHLEPRKSIEFLINSFIKIKEEGFAKNFKLVIVGKKNHDYHKTIELINLYKNDIVYLDFVSEETLFSLYQNTYLNIFPSIYEGFGFPILEAASFNVPSLCSNTTSLPEIGGDSCSYFEPLNYESFKTKLIELLINSDLYYNLIKKISENLDRFSWTKNAIQTIEVYKKVEELTK
ncbi:MAG: glycosyltransferase family 4 protein [Candidatus Delongbacteria bacterium]|nr:glycosyltransferase family 4 protein [Candidatus Delongbacteria bacterium]MBN2836848.1 glycosyltransferase family 4 protein [Candidatus Delongbacteria bacterium]